VDGDGPVNDRDGPEGGGREVEETEDSRCRGGGAYRSPRGSWYPDIVVQLHRDSILRTSLMCLHLSLLDLSCCFIWFVDSARSKVLPH